MNSSLQTKLQDLKSSSVWNYIFKFLIKWWCFAFVICKWPTLWINNKSSTNSNRYTIFIFMKRNRIICYSDETRYYRRLSLKPQIKWSRIAPGPKQNLKHIYANHAYVGNNNLNYLPNQDDDTINNQGDKCN